MGLGMYEIRQATVDEVMGSAQIDALFDEHWQELALNKQVMVLKPAMDRYYAMEAQGMLLCLAAFVEGELVGYSVNFVMNHLHYADLWVCSNDLLFVTKAHRQGRLGLQLMRKTEEFAKERGAKIMLWHAKENTALNAMLPRMGYRVQDVIYSREI